MDWCSTSGGLDRCLGWTSAAEVADHMGERMGVSTGPVMQNWLTKRVSRVEQCGRSAEPDGCQCWTIAAEVADRMGF